ncbi:MAG: hypothetical protein JST12_11060 [Armatimonadetes bacterium]|nr:hypothetical protein [Armatimonadota bacterium]
MSFGPRINRIHPSVVKQSQILRKRQGKGEPLAPEVQRAFSQFIGVWFKAHWAGCLLYMLSLAAGLYYIGTQLEWNLGPGFLLVWFIVGIVAQRTTLSTLTWDELEVLQPYLELSDLQLLYIDCHKVLIKANYLSPDQKEAWLKLLFDTLDEAAVLQELLSQMNDLVGREKSDEEARDLSRLYNLADTAIDPVTQKTYEESLRLARERIAQTEPLFVRKEQIKAHLELARQTLLASKSALTNLAIHGRDRSGSELDPLRENLEQLKGQSSELQLAVQELRQI